MFRRVAMTALLLLLGCAAEPDDKRTKCVNLREHLAEVTVAARAGNLPPDEQAKHRAALVASSGEEFIRRCVGTWSEKGIACGLEAGSADAVRRCVGAR